MEHTESAVSLEAGIFPQHGYPFHLTHRVRYELDNDGDLLVTQSLVNHSEEAAPVALGAHPYLRLGQEDTSGLTLTVPGLGPTRGLELWYSVTGADGRPVDGLYHGSILRMGD